jgi:hypothetical protein
MEGEFAAARQTIALVERFDNDVLKHYRMQEAVTQTQVHARLIGGLR